MQKPLKINEQSNKNGPKICLGGVSGGPWGLLAAKIETNATRTFGASWGHLGAVLGASWSRLGAWIAVLGRLGPSWGPLEPS